MPVVHADDADNHAAAALASTATHYGKPSPQKVAPMVIYEIPFEPVDSTDWHVDVSTDGRMNFESRQAALAYARVQAQARTATSGVTACISIQGGDGRWRLFDPQLDPLKPGPELLG